MFEALFEHAHGQRHALLAVVQDVAYLPLLVRMGSEFR
jgi:hypothetical protein